MRKMRRSDREKPKEFALALVDKSGYSVMATVSPDGSPYCIPLSFAREGEWLYFHSALEGHKIDNLRHNNKVCISCVGEQRAVPGEFALEYESAVVYGTALEVTDREEKTRILAFIGRRFAPDSMAGFDKYTEQRIDVTAVWKIHIDELSGKARKRQ